MHFQRKTIFLVIALCILLFFLFHLKIKNEMVDFEVNYKAGKRIWTGETLYRVQDGHYQFKYPPFSALLYVPLSFLPLPMAKAIWYFLIILSICFILFLCHKLLFQRKEKAFLIIILSPLILSKFFLRELQLGQINAFITLLLLCTVWWMVSDEKNLLDTRAIWTGILCGLAVALKPYALIFFPYFMITKRWKPLLCGLGFLVFAFLSPSLLFGISGNIEVFQEWISTFSQSTPSLLDSQDNISIIAFFMKWTGNQEASFFISIMLILGMAVLFLILVLKGRFIRRSEVLDCSILLILIPLISPLGWDYTLLMSVLGIMIILKNFLVFSNVLRAVLVLNFLIITFSLYDIVGRDFYAIFMSWSVTTVNFLILLAYLSYIRLKKIG